MRSFKHDCNACVFLGHYQGSDLYFCPRGGPAANGIPTVIARRSNDPPDYTSGMVFAMPSLKERVANKYALDDGIVALRVARLIAIDLGYDMQEDPSERELKKWLAKAMSPSGTDNFKILCQGCGNVIERLALLSSAHNMQTYGCPHCAANTSKP